VTVYAIVPNYLVRVVEKTNKSEVIFCGEEVRVILLVNPEEPDPIVMIGYALIEM
jgi:hypothetical protein